MEFRNATCLTLKHKHVILPTLRDPEMGFPYLGQSPEQRRCESREVWGRNLFAPVMPAYLAVFSELL